MKHLHQIAIKHLTYLILNKNKLDNKQPPVYPPPLDVRYCVFSKSKGAHLPRGRKYSSVILGQTWTRYRGTGSHSCQCTNQTRRSFYCLSNKHVPANIVIAQFGPTICRIGRICCRLQCFNWIENNIHLRDFLHGRSNSYMSYMASFLL